MSLAEATKEKGVGRLPEKQDLGYGDYELLGMKTGMYTQPICRVLYVCT